ncbi:MAG TPA: sigma-70 family RNA polymerase sigma factor [Flavobacterium sp.]|nr:sigma-70 family RNA polymerase sigma factor [Flavobacterium sp.]
MAAQKEALFKEVYSKYAKKIQRICLGYTGDSMLADDLLQEVFIKAWQNYDKFRGDALISTWVYRIAVNTCLNHVRATKNKATIPIETVSYAIANDDGDDKEDQVRMLYKCISQLSEPDRLIITMLLEEIPYAEIAVATSISDGNLRVKIHRIKQQLNTLFAQYERV